VKTYVDKPVSDRDFLTQRRDVMLSYAWYEIHTKDHAETFGLVTSEVQ
jgi:hypothetical protein